jgi:hypothetical protein
LALRRPKCIPGERARSVEVAERPEVLSSTPFDQGCERVVESEIRQTSEARSAVEFVVAGVSGCPLQPVSGGVRAGGDEEVP